MKLTSLLTSLLLVVMLHSWQPAEAQVGQWTAHAVFAAPPQKVIDTGNMVYFISGGSLFSFNPRTEESRSYTMSNGLNASTATGIFYNSAKHYLLVAYSTGNIDLVYDDGKIVNMSDISDSTIDPPLTINDVWFGSNSAYVATNFGLVEFDDQRHEVVQSGIYSTNVSAVTGTADGKLLIWADGHLHSTAQGSRFPSLSTFTKLHACTEASQLIPLDDGTVLAVSRTAAPSVSLHNIDNGSVSSVSQHTPGFYLTRATDGLFYFVADNELLTIDPASMRQTTVATLPDSFDGAVAGTCNGRSQVWTLTRQGIACHRFDNSEVTLLTDRHRPEEFSVKEVCYFYPTADSRRLFVTNNGTSVYRFNNPGFEGRNTPLTTAVIDLASDKALDLTPYPVEAHLPDAAYRQKTVGKYLLSPTSLAPDPDDENTFFVSTSIDGVYKMSDGELEGIYNEENSPLSIYDSRNIAYHVNIDRGGNLWMHTAATPSLADVIHILPAEKRKLDPGLVKKADWITLPLAAQGYTGGQDVQVLHCQRSNMTFISDHNTSYHFMAHDSRGTHSDFSDDRVKVWTRLVDQDGNTFTPSYCTAFCEDRDGAVWIGTDRGVIVISNPSNAINDNMTVRRVKVPKNDGTNMAEYLLGADFIYSITVDAANRKWIATERSGLFLVSADGSEIIENFTEDNSPLPSNLVYSVYASPMSATIYVGTPEGMFTYESNASPAMESYDNIVVYPNPVTPDYSGPIYVKGLMDGSLVKIADAAGRVLYQGRSEGGLFSWNGCNAAGERLPTGVYYVFASQNASGSSSGATAKFMIVK